MPTYNDGGVPYGINGLLGIAFTSSASEAETPDEYYVVEEIRVEQTGSEIVRRSGLNVVTGRVIIDDSGDEREVSSVNIRLQRATITQPFPSIGSVFLPRDIDTSAELIPGIDPGRVFAVASGGQNYGMADKHMFEIVAYATSSVL
jgi:hypothetical protein